MITTLIKHMQSDEIKLSKYIYHIYIASTLFTLIIFVTSLLLISFYYCMNTWLRYTQNSVEIGLDSILLSSFDEWKYWNVSSIVQHFWSKILLFLTWVHINSHSFIAADLVKSVDLHYNYNLYLDEWWFKKVHEMAKTIKLLKKSYMCTVSSNLDPWFE
mgnify:CR=1 FL=1